MTQNLKQIITLQAPIMTNLDLDKSHSRLATQHYINTSSLHTVIALQKDVHYNNQYKIINFINM